MVFRLFLEAGRCVHDEKLTTTDVKMVRYNITLVIQCIYGILQKQQQQTLGGYVCVCVYSNGTMCIIYMSSGRRDVYTADKVFYMMVE